MDFFDSLHISGSGLSAQRLRMNLISNNLANVNTTRTDEGGPYKKKEAIFEAREYPQKFQNILSGQIESKLSEVKVLEIVESSSPPVLKYDPGHPDANKKGFVAMPNVNLVEEMVNMISATRSYEANVAALNAAKKMALKALEIGK